MMNINDVLNFNGSIEEFEVLYGINILDYDTINELEDLDESEMSSVYVVLTEDEECLIVKVQEGIIISITLPEE